MRTTTNSRREPHPPGTGLEDRYLELNLPGDKTRQMFWAAFTYGHYTPLVPIRQRTEKERVDGRDRLGFNSAQYVKEIVVPYLLPLYEECGGANAGIQTIEDGSRVHTSRYYNKSRRMNGISRMPWPANSGDLNPIENVWALFKRRFREACRDPGRRPRNKKKLIELAQVVWEELPWERIYKWIDTMPTRITTVIRRGEGHTKW